MNLRDTDRLKKRLGIKFHYNRYFKPPFRLDLGCGPWKKEGFIGIDNCVGDAQWKNIPNAKLIDIDHDLSKGIPFQDATVEEVFAAHFLEHTDLDFMMREIHRILKSEGVLEFIVPYANSAEGMFPGHNVFLTEKFFQQNTLFNELFTGAQYAFTPSDEWESGEIRKYTDMPFDIAKTHFFNVCKWFTIRCIKREE